MIISTAQRQETGFDGHSIRDDEKLAHHLALSDESEAHPQLEVGDAIGKLVLSIE